MNSTPVTVSFSPGSSDEDPNPKLEEHTFTVGPDQTLLVMLGPNEDGKLSLHFSHIYDQPPAAKGSPLSRDGI